MTRLAFIAAAFMSLLLSAAPASAQVHYIGYVHNVFGFDFTTPTYITTKTVFTGAQANCVGSGPGDVCGSLTFDPNGGLNDLLSVNGTLGGGGFSQTAFLPDGAFTTPGTYTHPDSFTLLTVSNAPEASSWALMILGFGVAGFALRRTKRERGARPDRFATA